MTAILIALCQFPGAQSTKAEGFVELGRYFAHEAGPTALPLRLPDMDGQYRDWLSWGYPIWPEYNVIEPFAPGWLVSEDLTQPPYGLPSDATAVRLHIKAKVAGATWADDTIEGAMQIKVRPHGSQADTNEVIHAAAGKGPDEDEFTPYDLNHIEVDVRLGEGGRIEIYQDVSILGQFVQIDLVVYVAGYWR